MGQEEDMRNIQEATPEIVEDAIIITMQEEEVIIQSVIEVLQVPLETVDQDQEVKINVEVEDLVETETIEEIVKLKGIEEIEIIDIVEMMDTDKVLQEAAKLGMIIAPKAIDKGETLETEEDEQSLKIQEWNH